MNVWVWSWKQFLTLSANHRAQEDNGGRLGDKSWLSGGGGTGGGLMERHSHSSV